MVRQVLVYPHPLLHQRCHLVPPGRGAATIRDLVDTVRASPGCVGLAAPQIGHPTRIAVVDVSGHRYAHSSQGLIVLVNPVVLWRAGCRIAREGCLSLPEITADVARAERLVVAATNLSSPMWSEGFEARAIQHECDHLEGTLILDRVASTSAVHRRLRRQGTPISA